MPIFVSSNGLMHREYRVRFPMLTCSEEIHLAQEHGGAPTILAAGSAPGESGISVLRVRFQGSAHIKVTMKRHLVCFILSQVRMECRRAGRVFRHKVAAGSLATYPAGLDVTADTDEGMDALFVAIDPGRLALLAAEKSVLEAQLIDRPVGFDRRLLDLAGTLALECANGYPSGALFWNEVAGSFIEGLVSRHSAELECQGRSILGKDVLTKIRDYVFAHIDEPIDVASLAKIAGRSPFNFSRVFARSVGVTPHRYVVHLRLQRAIDIVRNGQSDLAEIAARTGFADQSHLARWVRRVHGVSLSQIAP